MYILRLKPKVEDENYLKIVESKRHAMTSIFNTVAKIDEARLRGQKRDRLAELLDAVRAEDEAVN